MDSGHSQTCAPYKATFNEVLECQCIILSQHSFAKHYILFINKNHHTLYKLQFSTTVTFLNNFNHVGIFFISLK